MQQGILVGSIVILLVIGTFLHVQKNSGTPLFSPAKTYEINGASTTGTVKRVIDGDTIELTNGEIIRYIGMNAPEIESPETKPQCFGEEAKNANRKLVEGKKVEMVRDVEDRDVYGRSLRYVFVNGIFVNEELTRLGYAFTLTILPNNHFVTVFKKAESDAKNQKLGLWLKCSSIFIDK
jgi:micrococcal nuclease